MFEARVWLENGDLVGYAEVIRTSNGWQSVIVHTDYPKSSGWESGQRIYSVRGMAPQLAQSYAKSVAQQLAYRLRAQCLCEEVGDFACGVLHEHGVSLQICDE